MPSFEKTSPFGSKIGVDNDSSCQSIRTHRTNSTVAHFMINRRPCIILQVDLQLRIQSYDITDNLTD